MAFFPGHPFLRGSLYALTWMFAVVLLGLTGRRIKNTEHDLHTYDRVVAELLVASCLAILWVPVGLFTVVRPARSASMEIVPLFVIWVFYLVGSSILTHKYPTRAVCNSLTVDCNIVIPLIAIAWVGFGLLSILMVLALMNWSAVNGSGVVATKAQVTEKRTTTA